MHPSHSAVGLLYPSHAAFLNNTYLLASFQDLQEKAGTFSSTPQPVSGTTGRGIEWEAATTRMEGQWGGWNFFYLKLSPPFLSFNFSLPHLQINQHLWPFLTNKAFSPFKASLLPKPLPSSQPSQTLFHLPLLLLYLSLPIRGSGPCSHKYALIFPTLSHFKPRSPSNSTSLHPNNFSINSQFALFSR